MIYFIRAEESGAVKIGKANNPVKRLAQLRTGSRETLTLLGAIPGGVTEERRLHDAFAAYRVRGEWFRGDPTLMEWIRVQLAPPRRAPTETVDLLNEGHVLCPCCGFDCTHIISHTMIQDGKGHVPEWGGAGNMLAVGFRGECGSTWELCFGFHKGITSAFTRVTKDCRELDSMVTGGAYDESECFEEVGIPTF